MASVIDDILTTADAAALAKCSLKMIYRAIQSGALVSSEIGRGRAYRITQANFWRWMRGAQGDPADEAYVFPTSRGSVMADTDYRNWRTRTYEPAARGAGIGGPPYDLRRSFASLLIYEGRPRVT